MSTTKKLLSITVPCFNEEENVEPMYLALKIIADSNKHYNFEFVFADNGSSDRTKDVIKKIIHRDKRVAGVFLSRNFGPEASLQAGLDYSTGEAVIGIAADFQEPPELISQFIEKWEKGNNIVVGLHPKIQDNLLMFVMRKLFYVVFKKISNINIPTNASGLCLLDRKSLNALKALPEKYRFFRGLRAWIGFKTDYIVYERRERVKGESSYSFIDYIKHAERGLFGFSYLVLDTMIYGGFILVFLSFAFFLMYLFTVLVIGNSINASIPLMLAIVFFGGIQLLAISVIGKYIQVIVEETKSRPVYIVDEIIGKSKK